MDTRQTITEQNRLSWNAATAAHNSHKVDQAAFFRAGGSKLFPEEIELLGDVRGARVVHLQCNAGQDTLSIAQLGAHVTGVDISDEAIEFARRLSVESGVPGEFHRADVYEWLDEAIRAGRQFDVVFYSYGALCWLPDLKHWARGAAAVLRPGGRLVGIEFHPVISMFDERLALKFPYFGAEPIRWEDGVRDYVADSGAVLAPSGYVEGVKDFRNPHACIEFNWSVADRLTAMIEAGLTIDIVREYPYSNGCKFFEGSIVDADRRWHLPPGMPAIPQMLAIVASRRA